MSGAAAFNLNRLRVTVDQDKLNKIADILEVSKLERAAIMKDGLVIATSPSASASAKKTTRAATTRSSPAARTPRRQK
ncbi:MAG TPA: hypothetical protein VMB84_13725 [Stellaceae bacterium]|nr:hypothetical protein [Stellaceae bacterium]